MNREELKVLADQIKQQQPVLVVCGGGHVGYHMAELGILLDFEVIVIDDREGFANTTRFPKARVICKPFVEALAEIKNPSKCYFAIVARGHAHDTACLKAILTRGFAYVGMMGSKVKSTLVMTHLREEGYDEALLSQVHTPIGIPCGAITPAEIAVSIAAELIQVKNTLGEGAYVGSDVVEAMRQEDVAVIATIIEKSGSAPRGIGSTLVLRKDGSIIGTVGGGNVENQVIKRAQELVGADVNEVMDCNLVSQGQGNLGMICGGAVKVQIQTVNYEATKEGE
ncbi:MAG: XdhC family protein [Cellulosilyticaceae bacterium]